MTLHFALIFKLGSVVFFFFHVLPQKNVLHFVYILYKKIMSYIPKNTAIKYSKKLLFLRNISNKQNVILKNIYGKQNIGIISLYYTKL